MAKKGPKGTSLKRKGHFIVAGNAVATRDGNLIQSCESPARARLVAAELNKALKLATVKKRSPGHGRRKGHAFERDIAIALRPIFPKARRQLEYHPEDAKGVDIQGTGRFLFQCKKFKTYAPLSCIKEIEHSKELGEIPVLITAADGEPALACLPLDQFIAMLRVWHGQPV